MQSNPSKSCFSDLFPNSELRTFIICLDPRQCNFNIGLSQIGSYIESSTQAPRCYLAHFSRYSEFERIQSSVVQSPSRAARLCNPTSSAPHLVMVKDDPSGSCLLEGGKVGWSTATVANDKYFTIDRIHAAGRMFTDKSAARVRKFPSVHCRESLSLAAYST